MFHPLIMPAIVFLLILIMMVKLRIGVSHDLLSVFFVLKKFTLELTVHPISFKPSFLTWIQTFIKVLRTVWINLQFFCYLLFLLFFNFLGYFLSWQASSKLFLSFLSADISPISISCWLVFGEFLLLCLLPLVLPFPFWHIDNFFEEHFAEYERFSLGFKPIFWYDSLPKSFIANAS